jgi:2-polyprenyl-3-methyl-5-hydroxy-6-metoxy-1,4-benzoquinol methylase
MNGQSLKLEQLIKRAESFCELHREEPHVQDTYGYFTRHPFSKLNQKRLSTILQLLKNAAPRKVLDIACGGGLITHAIASMGMDVLGVDINAEEIKLAETFTLEPKTSAQFLLMDMVTDQNWEKQIEKKLGGKPQTIVLAYALHHLPHVERFLERLSLWVEKDTLLIINEENPLSPSFRAKHVLRSWIQKDTETEWHRTFKQWKKLLKENQFQVSKQVIGLDMVPWVGTISPSLSWSLVFTAYKS